MVRSEMEIMTMNSNEMIKECRKLAKEQKIEFKRSKKVGTINGKACYELESGIQHKTLHQGCLNTIYETLLSAACANQ
ncbi:hypothetical protein DIKCMJMK_00150 [Shewanella oneidensis]|uniref:Mu phage uncharacterized protein n=2 Tax=Shewanella oneidensis TaxID=70863 RepID=Q8EDR1_SHEON|nr:Mu phage uncharacterized protein [Shewanella oneidensis MR-1]MEE2026301.1 hypothetical protein [Shewanella oneidensis]